MAKLSARSVTIACNSRNIGGVDKPDIEIIHSNGFLALAIHNGAGVNIKVWLTVDDAKRLSVALLEHERLELTP